MFKMTLPLLLLGTRDIDVKKIQQIRNLLTEVRGNIPNMKVKDQ